MPTCYLCLNPAISEEFHRVRDREDIAVLRCTRCGLVFLNTTDHISQSYYENSGMYNFSTPSIHELMAEEERDTTRRVNALKYSVQGKSYLDFGCGAGSVAKILAASARTTEVIEPNKKMQEHLSEYTKIRKHTSMHSLEGPYDVISFFHVLEHLPDPRSILKKLASYLTPNGFLYIEVPSSDDALIEFYKLASFKSFTYWSCHLYLFNLLTLRTLIEQAHLKLDVIEQVQRYPLANHLYWLTHGKPGGHKIWNFLSNPLLDQAYAHTLAQLGLCDTLVARVRHV